MSTRARWKRRIWVVAVVTAVVLCLVVLSRDQKPVLGEFTTPDGAYRVQVLQVGGASLSYHPHGRAYEWFYRTVSPWLPKSARSWLTKPMSVEAQAEPTKTLAEPLQILMQCTPQIPGRGQGSYADLARAEFVDRNGFRYGDSIGIMQHHGPGCHTLRIANFPRRDPTLMLHVVERTGTSEWARIELPNPIRATDAPRLTPQSLPAVITTPEFDCRLTELRERDDRLGYDPIVEVIPTSPAWKYHFEIPRLEDATGNYGRVLSPFEQAWVVHVDVCQTSEGEFLPQEIWQLPKISLPAPNTVDTLNLQSHIGETLVKATCIKGKGMGGADRSGNDWVFSKTPRSGAVQIPSQPRITYGTINTVSEEPFLQLDLEQFDVDDRLYATLVDQDGEVVGRLTDTKNTVGRYARTYYRATVAITPKPTSREISGQVVVTRPKVVKFQVAPPADLKDRYPAK